MLKRGAALVEERRGRAVLWTITIPDEAIPELIVLDSWQRFQTAIRHRLGRELRRRGVRPWFCGVAELHPQRSRDAGIAIPHLHVLLVGRSSQFSRWYLPTSTYDRIIRQAARAAGLTTDRWGAAGNLSPVKRSAAAYLAKYLTKADPCQAGVGHYELLPRRWWFMSADLRDQVDECETDVPAEWLAWLAGKFMGAGPRSICCASEVPDLPRGAPRTVMLRFRSPPALWLAWEAYESAVVLGRDASGPFRESVPSA